MAGILYLMCLARIQTGGTQAIHQLAHVLRGLGHDARIVYFDMPAAMELENAPALAGMTRLAVARPFDAIPADAMPADYRVYDTVGDTVIDDAPEHAFIVPESFPGLLRFGRRLQKYLWWLSLNNLGESLNRLGGFAGLKTAGIEHLVQSAYVEHYLVGQGLSPLHRLFDFTDPIFLEPAADGPRRDRVLYNPRKGAPFVARLIEASPELDWVPISGLAPRQVRDLLRSAKVYVDFGPHPGKDRIPREAAASGCCVITGRRGAAAHHPDLPIADGYKFADTPEAIPAITGLIRDCLEHFERHAPRFDRYRRVIRTERAEFEQQVLRIFGTGQPPG